MPHIRRLHGRGLPEHSYIFDDHRASLIAGWAALQDGIFADPPLLVRFDRHSDFTPEDIDWGKDCSSINDLDDVVLLSHRLESDDSTWVTACVELGIVSDVITFYIDFVEEDVPSEPQTYKDHRGREHTLIWMGRAKHSLDYQSDLTDTFRRSELKDVWNLLGWDPSKGWTGERALWFDIDLDFATHRLPNDFGCMPWRNVDFTDEFESYDECNPYRTVGCFFAETIKSSRLFTIAVESQ